MDVGQIGLHLLSLGLAQGGELIDHRVNEGLFSRMVALPGHHEHADDAGEQQQDHQLGTDTQTAPQIHGHILLLLPGGDNNRDRTGLCPGEG